MALKSLYRYFGVLFGYMDLFGSTVMQPKAAIASLLKDLSGFAWSCKGAIRKCHKALTL